MAANHNFLEELRWRGLIHDFTPGVEEHFNKGTVRAYIGFDPTAPSLTIGNYVQIMLLTFLQRGGHQPVVLMGGATGRIGDPSGKDKERDLKSFEELDANMAHQVEQAKRLDKFCLKEFKHHFPEQIKAIRQSLKGSIAQNTQIEPEPNNFPPLSTEQMKAILIVCVVI